MKQEHKFVAGNDGFCHVCGDHAAAHAGHIFPAEELQQRVTALEAAVDILIEELLDTRQRFQAMGRTTASIEHTLNKVWELLPGKKGKL
jgi:hypothetical protein